MNIRIESSTGVFGVTRIWIDDKELHDVTRVVFFHLAADGKPELFVSPIDSLARVLAGDGK